jgi:hypothetical protein
MKCKTGVMVVFMILMLVMLVVVVRAEKLDISVGNNYAPGDEVHFKVSIYDDSNNLLIGKADYQIQNYYTDVIEEGNVNSGEDNVFQIPTDAVKGPWRITAKYMDLEINRLFNVGELEKAEIKLEGDQLVIKNIGNVLYDKKILIYIGEQDQTINVFLEVGQVKTIRLTAPEGVYDIKVIGDVISETGEQDDLIYSGVSLTGKAVGLETTVQGGFWRRYPLVGVFLVIIVGLVIVVTVARLRRRFSGVNVNVKVSNRNIQKR